MCWQKVKKNVGPHCVGSNGFKQTLICFLSATEVGQAGQRMPPFLKQLIQSVLSGSGVLRFKLSQQSWQLICTSSHPWWGDNAAEISAGKQYWYDVTLSIQTVNSLIRFCEMSTNSNTNQKLQTLNMVSCNGCPPFVGLDIVKTNAIPVPLKETDTSCLLNLTAMGWEEAFSCKNVIKLLPLSCVLLQITFFSNT